jgi:hypothetical protein
MEPERPNEGRQQPDEETQAELKTGEEKRGQSHDEKKETARESHGRESHQSRPGG